MVLPSVADSGVGADADAGGGGSGSLLPGVCISPPNASVELEITSMVPIKKHRSVFIVFVPFWSGDGPLETAKSLSVKIITSLVTNVTK